MVNKVFLDTSFFKGFVDEGDDFHNRAVKMYEKMSLERDVLVTSNFVLDETITLVRVRCGVERVRDLREVLVRLDPLKIFRVTALDEKEAWDWFWNDWSKLSYTDCTSFAVMRRLGIRKVATFDDHFAKAGFKAMV